ncbi:unnamed protein product, partial [Heterosigma akashiwo]
MPLDANEGLYVRDARTGHVRAVVGETYMLKPTEAPWEKELPAAVEGLLGGRRDKARVVTYRVKENSVVQVYDYKKKTARVVFGPDMIMLQVCAPPPADPPPAGRAVQRGAADGRLAQARERHHEPAPEPRARLHDRRPDRGDLRPRAAAAHAQLQLALQRGGPRAGRAQGVQGARLRGRRDQEHRLARARRRGGGDLRQLPQELRQDHPPRRVRQELRGGGGRHADLHRQPAGDHQHRHPERGARGGRHPRQPEQERADGHRDHHQLAGGPRAPPGRRRGGGRQGAAGAAAAAQRGGERGGPQGPSRPARGECGHHLAGPGGQRGPRARRGRAHRRPCRG